jgi:transposase
MLTLPLSVKIVLASQPVDMRKSIDGLMGLVRNEWGQDVYSGHLFVFVSRRGDRVKILLWDRGGFVLCWRSRGSAEIWTGKPEECLSRGPGIPVRGEAQRLDFAFLVVAASSASRRR